MRQGTLCTVPLLLLLLLLLLLGLLIVAHTPSLNG
jgi:hypothetical protein